MHLGYSFEKFFKLVCCHLIKHIAGSGCGGPCIEFQQGVEASGLELEGQGIKIVQNSLGYMGT